MEEFASPDEKLNVAARPIKVGYGLLLAFSAALLLAGLVRSTSVPDIAEVPFFERTTKQHDEHFEHARRQSDAKFSGFAMMAFGAFFGFAALTGLKGTSRRMNRASAAVRVAAWSDMVDTVASADDLRRNAGQLVQGAGAQLASGLAQGARSARAATRRTPTAAPTATDLRSGI